MAITPADLIAQARAHLTEQDESSRFSEERLYPLVPSAISQWVEQTESDPNKSRNFLVETDTITASGGQADIGSELDAVGIQSQFVKRADIIIDYDGHPPLPVQFVQSHSRLILGGKQDKHFINVYFDGKRLYFRDGSDPEDPLNSFAGDFTIRAVSVPTTLAGIPSSAAGEIATIIATLARKFNTDGLNTGIQTFQNKI